MNWWDYIISAVCTIFSLIGAYKSNVYYQNSKQLTIYANTNSAFIESQKIITTLTKMLKLGNRIAKGPRGINSIKEVIRNGENIKASINKIRESLPVEDFNEIKELLNS